MAGKILLLERNEKQAKDIENALGDHELGAVRELTGGYFDLFIAVIREGRTKEGLRLIQILLIEGKVKSVAPVVVMSDNQDPAFIQNCVKAGVADYVLCPDGPIDGLARATKLLDKAGGLGEMLVRVATTFLGPAAGMFIERQAKEHFSISGLTDRKRDHLPEFLRHLAVNCRPIMKEKVVQFIHRLEQVFGVKRSS